MGRIERNPTCPAIRWRDFFCAKTKFTAETRSTQRKLMNSLRAPRLCGEFLFCIPWIIRRIDVIDLPWADAVELEDGFALHPGEVMHAGRPVAVGARRQRVRGTLVELVAEAEVQGA